MKKQIQAFFRFFLFRREKHTKGNFINLSTEKIKQVTIQMNEYMELEQPYLQHGYNVKSLADELRIPAYQLSALLNRHVGKNFNDYLNEYRVSYCKKLINEGEADSLNLKGLSQKCGFNNRNTFTAAFKKFTGLNPSDYTRTYQNVQKL